MTAVAEPDTDMDADIADLLPDELAAPKDGAKDGGKGNARPLVRTPQQEARAAAKAEADALRASAAQLAQIVNLHIAGYSLADIGASIGASASEVDRLLSNETARYVRNQPALRTYVRNYVSGKYTSLLEAVWDEATDRTHPAKLENQDRALRILDKMARLHGAEAPTQSEVKVDAAPEAVERLVQSLAAGQGLAYDTDIFDRVAQTVPGTVVHQAVEQSARALEVSGNRVEESDGDDDL